MSTSAKIIRHPAQLKRAFESAGIHPALSAWVSAAIPPDVDIRNSLRSLRARSRDAAQNDDHMAYFLRLVESNVIGRQGIVVQSRPKLLSGNYDKSSASVLNPPGPNSVSVESGIPPGNYRAMPSIAWPCARWPWMVNA